MLRYTSFDCLKIYQLNNRAHSYHLLPVRSGGTSDLKCFRNLNTSRKDVTWAFSVYSLQPHLITQDVYVLIEFGIIDPDHANMPLHLSYFWRLFTDTSSPRNPVTVKDHPAVIYHFRTLIASLRDYSMDVFDRFYWTAPATEQFYASHSHGPGFGFGNSVGFAMDRERARRWRELRDRLKSLRQGASADVDVCHFASLQITALVGVVSYHLSKYQFYFQNLMFNYYFIVHVDFAGPPSR